MSTLPDVGLERDVELCFTAPLTKHTQRVFTTGDPV